MASEKATLLDTVSAGANLTGKETFLGTISGGLAVLASAATAPLFVIYEGAAQGRNISRQLGGIARVTCGGPITAGDKVTSNGSGQAITTTTTGNYVVGEAREAGVSGQVISIVVRPYVI